MPQATFLEAQAATLRRYGVEAEDRFVASPSVGGEAHVLVSGRGPDVVMLNGIGIPAAMFAPLMAQLDGFRIHAIDLPGFGLTSTSTSFHNDPRGNAVSFLSEVLAELALDQPAFVTNSLGSLWATWFALDQPHRVAKLAHVGCPALAVGTSAPLPMRLLSVRPAGRLMMKLQPPSAAQVAQLSKMVKEHPLPPEIAALVLATERLPSFKPSFLAMLHDLLRLRGARPAMRLTAAELANVTQPSLLVFAKDDPMGGPEAGARMAAALNHAELHVVEGGHAPFVHHSERVGPIVASFLQGS